MELLSKLSIVLALFIGLVVQGQAAEATPQGQSECFRLSENPQFKPHCNQQYRYNNGLVLFEGANGQEYRVHVFRQYLLHSTTLINAFYRFEAPCGSNCNTTNLAEDMLLAFKTAVLNNKFYEWVYEGLPTPPIDDPCLQPGELCFDPLKEGEQASLENVAPLSKNRIQKWLERADNVTSTVSNSLHIADRFTDVEQKISGPYAGNKPEFAITTSHGRITGICTVINGVCDNRLTVRIDNAQRHESSMEHDYHDENTKAMNDWLNTWFIHNRPQLQCNTYTNCSSNTGGQLGCTSGRICVLIP